jgi:hypothetical protein
VRLMHGAWLYGADATEQELETANAAMEELERLGAHSADVIARWMRVHGIHGVKGDTEQSPSRTGCARPPATHSSESAGTTSPATAAPPSGPPRSTCGGSTTRQPPTPSSSAASTTAPGPS